MHLLMVTTEFTPFAGGIARYGRELADAAREAGWTVRVVAPSHGEITTSDGLVQRYATGYDFSPSDLLRGVRAVRSACGRDHPDVIHATDYRALAMVCLSGVRARVARLVTFHGSDVKGASGFKNLLQRLLLNGTRVVANSEHTGALVRERLGVSPNVTPLGVSQGHFSSSRGRSASRALLGLHDEDFVIACVARIERRKAQDVLIASLPEVVRHASRPVRVLLVGDDGAEMGSVLRSQAAAQQLPVLFLGRVTDDMLMAVYQAADVFCLPGRPDAERVEGFGLVYLEAAAFGLPSVASAVDAIPEVVKDGRTGLVVAPQDPTALAHALLRLESDPALLTALGREARAASEMCSWARTAALTYGVFGHLKRSAPTS